MLVCYQTLLLTAASVGPEKLTIGNVGSRQARYLACSSPNSIERLEHIISEVLTMKIVI